MKKNIIFIFCLMVSFMVFGQVGINTETPQKTLHVNGSLQIVNELNVGGNSVTAGNPGTNGQILTSSGADLPPIWITYLDVSGITEYGSKDDGQQYNGPQIKFNSLPIHDPTVFSVNSDKSEFTILKDGIFNVNFFSELNTTSNGMIQGAILLNGVKQLGKTYSDQIKGANSISIKGYFTAKAGDVITLTTLSTGSYNLNNSALGITYLPY